MRANKIESVGLVLVLIGLAMMLVGVPNIIIAWFIFFGSGVCWGAWLV